MARIRMISWGERLLSKIKNGGNTIEGKKICRISNTSVWKCLVFGLTAYCHAAYMFRLLLEFARLLTRTEKDLTAGDYKV